MKAYRGNRDIDPSILNLGFMCIWVVTFTRLRLIPGKESGTLYGLDSRSGISGGDTNLMPLQGFEPRSVKHVPSRCTGSAIPAQKRCSWYKYQGNITKKNFALYRYENGASVYSNVSSYLLREKNNHKSLQHCGLYTNVWHEKGKIKFGRNM